jgi:UDP-N-acetyl-D-mannosaminuronic acid transferase (WecB/TagA/CpsF family)
MPILAVGSAFLFLVGEIPHAPAWTQDAGLEGLRLLSEPQRRCRRYVFLNTMDLWQWPNFGHYRSCCSLRSRRLGCYSCSR